MRAQLLHLSGPLRGRTVTHRKPVLQVGSAAESEVELRDPAVAPHHAEIAFVAPDCAFHLKRAGGAVFVNGGEVEEVILQDGDLIEWGAGGPKTRFRTYWPPGSVCKPVRRMLADARDVANSSGGASGTRSFVRDLFTQATLKLKIGFPLAVLALAFLAGWLGGWLETRRLPRPRTADTVTQAELEEVRRAQQAQEQTLARLAAASAAVRRIHDEWVNGVCLLHGEFRLRLAEGGYVPAGDGTPFSIEYTGSGFLASKDGHVVTNRHVAAPWERLEGVAELVESGAIPEMTTFNATFPGREPVPVPPASVRLRADGLDVAVVKLDPAAIAGIPVLPLHDGPLDPEQRAIVVGYPTGIAGLLAKADPAVVAELRRAGATMGEAILRLAREKSITPMVTQGFVGNVQPQLVVYDAPTTHGASGGPVFGSDGAVIAVNFGMLGNSGVASFGVPIRFARELLE